MLRLPVFSIERPESVEEAVQLLSTHGQRASVVAIGPGLGQGDWGRMLLDAAVASGKPLLLDADALNLLVSWAATQGQTDQAWAAPTTAEGAQ